MGQVDEVPFHILASQLDEVISASKRSSINDSERLRKYLARFDLEWAHVSDRAL